MSEEVRVGKDEIDDIWARFQHLVNARTEITQRMYISGVGYWHHEIADPTDEQEEECLGIDPFLALQELMNQMQTHLTRVRMHIQMHIHDWNDNYFCNICGWNGNA